MKDKIRDIILPRTAQIKHESEYYNEKNPINYFLFCVLFGIFTISIFQSHWLLSGEMFAEAAVVFFYDYYTGMSVIPYLLGQDAGYLSLPQRLIAIIPFVFGIPLKYSPYLYEIISFSISIVCISAFCLKIFRSVIQSDINRAILVCVLILVRSSDTTKLISFTYLCFPLLVAVILSSILDNRSRPPIWFYLVPILLYTTKPHLIVASVPLLIISSLIGSPRFAALRALFYAAALANVLRLMYSLQNGIYRNFSTENSLLIYDRIYVFIDSSTIHFSSFLSPHLPFIKIFGLEFKFILLVMFFVCAHVFFVRSAGSARLIFIAGICAIVGNNAILSFGLRPDQFAHFASQVAHRGLLNLYRWNILSGMGLVLCVYGMMTVFAPMIFRRSRLMSVRPIVGIAFVALLGANGTLIAFGQSARARTPIDTQAWQIAGPRLDNATSLCVPVVPHPWLLGIGCQRLSALPPNSVPTSPAIRHSVYLPRADIPGSANVYSVAVQVDATNRIGKWNLDVGVVLSGGEVVRGNSTFYWPRVHRSKISVVIYLERPVIFSDLHEVEVTSIRPFRAPGKEDQKIHIEWFGS